MQSTNEAAVRQLLSHISGVESERRVTMMKLKEAEMRLQGKEAQRSGLLRELSSLRDKELGGKSRLAQLLDEQRTLSHQLASGTEAIKQAEGQEQHLLAHNKDVRGGAEAQQRVWEGRCVEVTGLEKAWLDGCGAAKLKQDLASADSRLADLCAAERSILDDIACATARRRDLAARKAAMPSAGDAPTTAQPAGSTVQHDEATRDTLRAALDAVNRDILDHTSQAVPQRDGLVNEVRQLERRANEMAELSREMAAGTTSIEHMCCRLLDCVQRQLCQRCIQ